MTAPDGGRERVRTDDEMCEVWIGFVTDSEQDSAAIHHDAYLTWLRPADPAESTRPVIVDEVVAQLRKSSLWTPAGEKLPGRVAASNQFEKVVSCFATITQRERRDANVFIVYGTLLAWSTELSTNENEQYRLGMQAEKAFNAVIAID